MFQSHLMHKMEHTVIVCLQWNMTVSFNNILMHSYWCLHVNRVCLQWNMRVSFNNILMHTIDVYMSIECVYNEIWQ